MSRSSLIALVIILLVLIAGFVIIVDGGHNEGSYAIFVAGPLVSTIVGAVLAQRTARVEAVVEQVKHQTNSMLTARLDTIDGELRSASVQRTEDPPAGGQP